MDEVSNLFNRFTNVMDQNIKGVQLGCYSVAFVGLTIALRKVRPFSTFRKPSDIPNHFIQERRELSGLVKRIEPSGALLMIQHKPLVQIPGLKTDHPLPVKISGVNVSSLGITWLQTIVAGNEVMFVPVLKEKNCVQCEVLLPQTTHNKKIRIVNVGESLLKIGFGQIVTVDKPLANDPKFLTYYHRLELAEAYALRRKLGLKYYIKPTKAALRTLVKSLGDVIKLIEKTTKSAVKTVPKYAAI